MEDVLSVILHIIVVLIINSCLRVRSKNMWSETLAIENATYLQYIKPKIAKLIILINVN